MQPTKSHRLIPILIGLVIFFVLVASQLSSSNVPKLTSLPNLPTESFDKPLSPEVDKSSFLYTDIPSTSNQSSASHPDQLNAILYGREDNTISLQDFRNEISNGDMDIIRGVFVPDQFAFPVIQQPDQDPVYVSNRQGLITQFSLAKRSGITGFLAHNYLAGELFYNLDIGEEVFIIYGDGKLKSYRVSSIHRFQKLDPKSLKSNYRDLSTGKLFTTKQIFNRFYRGVHRVTFQTCLESDGDLNWGLTFITATPLK